MDDDILSRAKKIKCLICDVDGVLTDGRLYMDIEGRETKAFHVHDGVGLKLLLKAGIEVAVITTSIAPTIKLRMEQLGIKHYFTGQINKLPDYLQLKKNLKLNDEHFAYIGDDLPDLPILQSVGLPITVANAASEVKKHVLWETKKTGGNGAVREVCDYILGAQDKLFEALDRYLS